MKFLLISKFGEAMDIAFRLSLEGNTSHVFIQDDRYKVGDGIVDKVKTVNAKNYDVIWFDGIDFPKYADSLRRKGYKVFGDGAFAANMENDRKFGHEVMESIGLKRTPCKEFHSFDDGIRFIKSKPARYVIKPQGSEDKYYTYVGKDEKGEDISVTLEYFKTLHKERKLHTTDFILEEYIKGVEIGLTAYFNGKDFVEPYNILIEHKKLLSGEIGQNSGEMGSLVIYQDTKWWDKTILKLKPVLQKYGFVGQLGASFIIKDGDIFPLEINLRLGYPEIWILYESQKTEWGKILHGVASGQLKKFDVLATYALGVNLCGMGFPFPETYKKYGVGTPILGIDHKNIEHIHFVECEYDGKEKEYYSAGDEGTILCCTGKGESWDEAQAAAYHIVSQITIPNMMYRNDIGDKFDKIKDVL